MNDNNDKQNGKIIKIDVDRFFPDNLKTEGDVYYFNGSFGALTCSFSKGTLFDTDISADNWLVMDMTIGSCFSAAVNWSFFEDTGKSINFRMGLLPNIKTRVAIPLKVLNGQSVFLPRTPGKLKTVTQGSPIDIDRLSRFSFSVPNAPSPLSLKIHNIFISDTEPEYPLEPIALVDELGQKCFSDWPGKTKDVDALIENAKAELSAVLPPMEGRNRFGGYMGIEFEASGFFRVEHDGRRYWLVDPDGNAFISVGLDCVSIDGNANLNGIECLTSSLPPKNEIGWTSDGRFFSWHKRNLYTAYGEDWFNIWADKTKRRLEHWGFNTIGAWSDYEYIDRAKQPYVYIFNNYPKTEKRIFRDFPDVFDPAYAESAIKWAEQIRPRKDDPYMIGFFMQNEPAFAFVNNINLGEMLMANPENFASKKVIIDKLSEKYDTIEKLNTAWGASFADFDSLHNAFKTEGMSETARRDMLNFTYDLIHQYIKIPAEALRRVDSNHLNLGLRWAWLSSPALAAGSEYFDVYSFNCYSMDPSEAIENTLKIIKKPLIIGEFHFGALDRGMDATGLRGVTSQKQRGVAYRYYMHKAVSHPYCLGAHYFTLNDQAYLGRFDGENYQIGLVDVCDRPYDEFIDGIMQTNSEIYDIASGKIPCTEEKAKEIEAICF